MNNSSQDKLFEAMLKKALDKYADNITNEPLPMLDQKDEVSFEKNKKKVYDRVKKLVKKKQRKIRPKSRRRILMLIAIFALMGTVMAVNATAFKTFLFKTFVRVEGDVLNISANYSDFNEQYNDIVKFEYKDELIIPSWMPNEAQLIKVEDDYKNIRLKYAIADKYLEILEFNIESEDNSSNIWLENNTYEIETIKVLGMQGKMAMIKYESGLENAVITFCSDKTKYVINSTLSKTQLRSILEELQYYK